MGAPSYEPFIDYAGCKDGVCIIIASKHMGDSPKAAKCNAQIVADMIADGCQEVRELPLRERGTFG